MAASNVWVALVRILQVALEGFLAYRRRERRDAVRADGGSAWLCKHGGTDERVSPGTDDAGGGRDKH